MRKDEVIAIKMKEKYKEITDSDDFVVVETEDKAKEINEYRVKDNNLKQAPLITANKESQTIYSNRPLVTFKNGNYWTAKETYEKLENLSPRQYKRINSMDNLMNIIRGLAAREQMLVHAEKLELSNHTRFTGLLENHYHSYLVNECLERLFDHNEELDQHPDLKHSIYKEFRDGLAENALISIDSSAIKKFILPLGESS